MCTLLPPSSPCSSSQDPHDRCLCLPLGEEPIDGQSAVAREWVEDTDCPLESPAGSAAASAVRSPPPRSSPARAQVPESDRSGSAFGPCVAPTPPESSPALSHLLAFRVSVLVSPQPSSPAQTSAMDSRCPRPAPLMSAGISDGLVSPKPALLSQGSSPS
ncbi:unnamed protein product [Rangifer tarandus platyrhynchus]|uniref:Uncharacterized protein n=1 Tax=Rangifer tarandus platyrhynchus TaxID=3082113 RepID=A0AC59Z6H7_RANTA